MTATPVDPTLCGGDPTNWIMGRSMSVNGLEDMTTESSCVPENNLVLRSRCMSADDALVPAVDKIIRSPPDTTPSAGGFWLFSSSTSSSGNDNMRSRGLNAGGGFWGDATSCNGGRQSPDALLGEGDDDSTVGYYDSSDFLPTNWTQAVNIIPPVGLAVVASGIALLHPLLFVMGAVTAFGTMHAASACYDCCIDGALCKTTTASDDEKKFQLPATSVPTGKSLADVTIDLSLVEDDNSQQRLASAPLKGEHNEEQPLSTTLPALPSAADVEDTSILKSDPSKLLNTADALEWVNLHYPQLENTALKDATFFGLNALEFFNVFFANTAPFTFQEIQKQRGDKDIQYGQWEDLPHVSQPSLHHDALACTDLNVNVSSFRERVLKFHAKTNTYFGPPFANTTKVQRVLMASKRLMVMESDTTVTQIPFCDRFHVLERWVVTAEKEGGQYVSKLSVYSEVFFSQSCPFETQIVNKSKETIVEIAKAWCKMAQTALKLTEESRLKRIRGEKPKSDWEHLEDDASVLTPEEAEPPVEEVKTSAEEEEEVGECIEVQHRNHFRSVVLGEEGAAGPHEEETDLIQVMAMTDKVRTPPKRSSSRSSFVRMGRSLSKLVLGKKSSSRSSEESFPSLDQ